MEFVAIPIIIEAVNNGLKIIMMVREKIREYKARNQLLKAMEKRISSLIPCFELLYTRVNRLSEQAINNIIDIVLRINDFCARISASQDIWTKIKRFFNNGDEVKEMISLNKELNTAQKDLQIPLKLEESIKIDQIFATLQEIIPKTYELFEKYEKDNKILPLSKKVLTNEEAFIFWIECFPTKYSIPISKFEKFFGDYIEIYKNVRLDQRYVKMISKMLIKDNETLEIDAQGVNSFFECLPIDIQWDEIDIFLEYQNMLIEEEKAEEKVDNILNENTKEIKLIYNTFSFEEKKLLENKEYFRFSSTKSNYYNKNTKSEMNVRNIFIEESGGKLQMFGSIKKLGDFIIVGNVDSKGGLKVNVNVIKGSSFAAEGRIKNNEQHLLFKIKAGTIKIYIYIDIEIWFWNEKQNRRSYDRQLFFKISGNDAFGFSLDEKGFSMWRGKRSKLDLKIIQYYANHHYSISYIGKIDIKGNKINCIKGKWYLQEKEGEFLLTQTLDRDEEDSIIIKY